MGKYFAVFVLLLLVFSASVQNSEACFSIVAGKSATVDGSVLLAHNEDNAPNDLAGITRVERSEHGNDEWVVLSDSGKIPQKALTFGYLCVSMPYVEISDNVLNEYGVAVASNNCPSREDKPEISDGGIFSPALRHLVAQRAKTAREGVELVGSLVEKFGYATSSGRTLLICDPNEGWLLGLVKGKHWAAARVPDDEVAFLANTFSIHEIDLKDTENFLGSPGLLEYAIKRGWHDPENGPFDFEKTFSFRPSRLHAGNLNRQWSAMSKVAAGNIPLPETQNLPFSIKPKSKVSVRTMFSILRDHYEGTPVWRMEPENATPHDGPFTICNHDTNYSSVYQLRSHMPVEIGALWWCAMSAPCSTPYLPIHLGTGISPDIGFKTNRKGVPTGFGPVFDLFHSVKNWSHKDFAKRKTLFQKMWCQLEYTMFETQDGFEKKALEKWPENKALSREMLTLFSSGALSLAKCRAESVMKLEGSRTTPGKLP